GWEAGDAVDLGATGRGHLHGQTAHGKAETEAEGLDRGLFERPERDSIKGFRVRWLKSCGAALVGAQETREQPRADVAQELDVHSNADAGPGRHHGREAVAIGVRDGDGRR